MSIDEAIEELTESYNFWMQFACDDVLEEGEHKVNHCEKNANYCYQLIQWLEELKYHKSLLENTKTTNPMYEIGYNKAIEDYNKILKQRSIKMGRKVSTNFSYKIVYHKAVGTNEIDRIAEQLKGGVKNG